MTVVDCEAIGSEVSAVVSRPVYRLAAVESNEGLYIDLGCQCRSHYQFGDNYQCSISLNAKRPPKESLAVLSRSDYL